MICITFFKEEKSDNYFLGSIVLIKEEQKRYAEVIDGQQRLTTLSILFSAMADAFGDSECKSDCKAYLCEKEKHLKESKQSQEYFSAMLTIRSSTSTFRMFS